MSGWTLEEAQDRLKLWMDAEAKVANGQSVEIGDKRIRYADLDQVRKQIAFWRNEVDRLERIESGKAPMRFVRTRFV